MLKSFLLSGWFRVQPFIKYVAVVIVIAPLLGVSIHSTLAKQSQSKAVKVSLGTEKSDSTSPENNIFLGKPKLGQLNPLEAQFATVVPLNTPSGEERQGLLADHINSGARENYQSKGDVIIPNNLTAVPQTSTESMPVSPTNLVQKLKQAKIAALQGEVNSPVSERLTSEQLATLNSSSGARESQPSLMREVPIEGQQNQSNALPDDPMGSPHPIPWKWIMTTQEAIGGKGSSGVRYYRSIPVVSPDGRYAVYSRVELAVKPELYNSQVNSLLFIEDRQTKQLKVIAKTAAISDPLLQQTDSIKQTSTEGKIGVLVPVSWSEKGDRFLARQFVGIFNTADVTDHAVIWDRQQNNTKIVAPAQGENEHEKIAILLGWSKKQPDNALFRAGELGEENWPLVQVASDGKSVNVSTDADQPVTFGVREAQMWVEPQVASR